MSDKLSQNPLREGDQSPSGADFKVIYVSNGRVTRLMQNLQTISFSTHSEMYPVRSFGSKAAKAYARGIRTVAGTMIFLLKENDPFINEIIVSPEVMVANGPYEKKKCYIDNLPEFDLIVQASSEVPDRSIAGQVIVRGTSLYLQGVNLPESGATMSIHDLYTEIMYTYVAGFVVPFQGSYTAAQLNEIVKASRLFLSKTTTSMMEQMRNGGKQAEKTAQEAWAGITGLFK
jgi:hypothetical protein